MKTPQIVVGGVLGLLLLGGGFAAGMTVGRNAGASATASASPSGAGRFGQGGGAAGRGVVGGGGQGAGGQQLLTGRILSVNDGSITVEVRQGGGGQGASPTVTSEIVLVGTTTRIVKSTETDIKASDLKPNDQIQIVGATESNGNVSASAIVIGGNALQNLFGGAGFGGGGNAGGGRGASPSPSPTR